MRKNIFITLLLTCFIVCVSNTQTFAQNKPKKGTVLPEGDNEEAQEDADKAKEERAKEPKTPLTKKQAQRAMREREKTEKKNYEEHQESIQQEATYKRMKQNKKRAEMVNNKKKPNFIQRLRLKTRKK